MYYQGQIAIEVRQQVWTFTKNYHRLIHKLCLYKLVLRVHTLRCAAITIKCLCSFNDFFQLFYISDELGISMFYSSYVTSFSLFGCLKEVYNKILLQSLKNRSAIA